MELQELIEKARDTIMTPAQRESQRQSFAYGNSNLENEAITRDTVRQASENLKAVDCGGAKK